MTLLEKYKIMQGILERDFAETTKETRARGSVLDEAIKVINGDRQDSYGNPEDSFQLIADFWDIYLQRKHGKRLDSHDVCMMMTLFKIAREMHQKKRDNLVDASGYLGIAGDLYE